MAGVAVMAGKAGAARVVVASGGRGDGGGAGKAGVAMRLGCMLGGGGVPAAHSPT